MRNESIKKAVGLGKKLGYVFLTTADNKGIPHLGVASKISISAGNKLSVCGWFCPGTAANLADNSNLGVTVWDKKSDIGYQLLGQKQSLREIAVLDGYAPGIEKNKHFPQVEREIVIDVEKVFEFRQAPHTDAEV